MSDIKKFSSEPISMNKNLQTDFLSDCEAQRLVRNTTPQQFANIISGQIRTRPKIIRDPQSQQFYRLIPSEDRTAEHATYEPIHIKPTEILFIETDKVLKISRCARIACSREGAKSVVRERSAASNLCA
jgi:hypothetical protein